MCFSWADSVTFLCSVFPLWPFFCSLSGQWCRRCTVKLKHWQKRKKKGGVEDEFPVCECASGVKSLAYLPPLFHFSFCDRWGMLAAIYSWIFACLAGNMPRQSCYVKGPIEEQGPYYSDLRYFQQFIFCWNLFYLDRCLLMHRQILLFAISLSAMAFR